MAILQLYLNSPENALVLLEDDQGGPDGLTGAPRRIKMRTCTAFVHEEEI